MAMELDPDKTISPRSISFFIGGKLPLTPESNRASQKEATMTKASGGRARRGHPGSARPGSPALGRACSLLRFESERLKLPAPFSRRIAEPFDADATGQATFEI